MKTQPKEICLVQVEAVLMPNGEVICKGKTIGWFKWMKEHLTVKLEKGPSSK